LNAVVSRHEIGDDALGLEFLEVTGHWEVHRRGHHGTVDAYPFSPVQDPGKEALGERITDSQRVRTTLWHDDVVERDGSVVGVRHIHHFMLWIYRTFRMDVAGEPAAQPAEAIEPIDLGIREVILRSASAGYPGDFSAAPRGRRLRRTVSSQCRADWRRHESQQN
jgi:hypothetical protein